MESKIDIARNCLRFDIVKKDNIKTLQVYKVTYNGFKAYDVNKRLILSKELITDAPEAYIIALVEKVNNAFCTFKLSDESLIKKLNKLI